MGFLNTSSTIIRRSDKGMFFIRLDDGIVFDYFNNQNELISSQRISPKKDIDFTNINFTLDKHDNIYGIYDDSNLILIEIPNYSSEISKKEIISYDNKKFDISFPYINCLDDSIHILYYVYNMNNSDTCALFHHYKEKDTWIENKIDFIDNIILDNFSVISNRNSLVVFYFKLVNSHEQLFFSQFNSSNSTWSTPIQITNSDNSKIYLSVLKDSMNFYHISFCENIDSGYVVRYLNGYLSEGKFDIEVSSSITSPSTCMYPSLLQKGSIIYIMWVEFGKLKTSISYDFGKTWSKHKIDEFSIEEDFIRSSFISNYKDDIPYNVSSVFTTPSIVEILGF